MAISAQDLLRSNLPVGATGPQGISGFSGQIGSTGPQGISGFSGLSGFNGSIIYPGAGIAVSTGTAWDTSKTEPTGDIVGTTDTQTLLSKTITGTVETSVDLGTGSGTQTINLANGNYFKLTVNGASTIATSNVPTSGSVGAFVLQLINGGSFAITYMTGTLWPNGTAPVLTASGTDILGFYTIDSGTTWNGLILARDEK